MNPGWLALALAVLLPLHPRLQARLLRISFERIPEQSTYGSLVCSQ